MRQAEAASGCGCGKRTRNRYPPRVPSHPERLGPYRVLGVLGRGGMAEVLRAEAVGASGFSTEVALKVLRPELRGTPSLERLLIEEARLGAGLSHPNLVAVHDLGLDQGVYFVRMELVSGADLSSLVEATSAGDGPKDRALEPALAVYFVEQVALALAYVHSRCDARGLSRGLVHRDVSPQNVLVSAEGHVKLGDFGIAKQAHAAETTQAHLRRGKYAYMSPEQIEKRSLSGASDQFGLGVMLYELCFGRRPFEGESPLVVLDKIRAAEPPVVEGVDEAVGEVILRCLSRAPEDRFASTEALARTLFMLRRMLRPLGPLDAADWVNERLARSAQSDVPRRASSETRPLTQE
jgi:serine/threonine protein kinase